MFLSIIIPAFNEEQKIARDIGETAKFLSERPYSSEILVVDDGSSDQTLARAEVAARSQAYPRVSVSVLNYGANRGKGYATRFGVQAAHGGIIGFMDSGLCVPLRFIDVAVAKIQSGSDFAIGSRRLPGNKITKAQPLHRQAGSKVFWYLMRAVMGVRVTDTQCGFKFFGRPAAQTIFSELVTDGFMFDVESLLIAQKMGFKGAEFPVEWSNDADSRYALVMGTLRNFRELARIRYRLRSMK